MQGWCVLRGRWWDLKPGSSNSTCQTVAESDPLSGGQYFSPSATGFSSGNAAVGAGFVNSGEETTPPIFSLDQCVVHVMTE